MPTRLTDELADALTNLETVGYDTPYNSAMFFHFFALSISRHNLGF